MRRSILAASVAAVALVPSISYDQSICERNRSNPVAVPIAGGLRQSHSCHLIVSGSVPSTLVSSQSSMRKT